MRALIAKKASKEVVVCSDVDNSEGKMIFGIYSLTDEEREYIHEELGDDFDLDVVENY